MSVEPRAMTPDQQKAFTNALREAIGLGPLYGTSMPQETEPTPWWAVYIGDGNRRVRGIRF